MRRFCAIVLMIVAGFAARAQVVNLGSFDKQKLHWGIQVGYTQSKFQFDCSEDPVIRAFSNGTTSYYQAGFHIAVLGDLRLSRYVNARLTPGLTLVNRGINYWWNDQFMAQHPRAENYRMVESVYGEIPFDLKFRAHRWRNFRPYLTAGTSYGFDFASLRNNRNNDNQSIVRLNTSDFRYTTGVGFDFYLRYVKFAIEMRMSFGQSDLLIEDTDLYTLSVNDLHTRTFMLSFTFEG